jgi:phage-related protein
MLKLVQLAAFKKETKKFPLETKEDLFILVERFLNGERMNNKEFKTFSINKNIRIQEFKVKDAKGNWRAISFIMRAEYLVFVYAFHKKTQKLMDRDKELIIRRIRSLEL